ncbi:hypothetical protein [Brevundimonas aveniformis]|uniref:hypothetical protein n=1 Tax=Brevundimonas aveniformis TaxID=370977 RepID=UPI002493C9A1|nr:hypothetical protein [Brevundimonas aveniformis]
MYRALPIMLALAACTAEPPTSDAANTPLPAETTAEIETLQILDCDGHEFEDSCRRYRGELMPAEYDRALAGDYQAQRNVAYHFSRESTDAVSRPIQACAWRQVIMATRPADAGYTDESSLRLDCDSLSERDRAEADQVANLIHRRIHGSDLPVAE